MPFNRLTLTDKWLNIIVAFGVLVAVAYARLRLPEVIGTFELGVIIFSVALLFSGIFEITVKPRSRLGYSKTRILFEVLWVWIIPALIGYYIVRFLK